MNNQLRETALKLLKHHNGVKDALAPFITAVKGDPALMDALARDFLDRVKVDLSKTVAPSTESVAQKNDARDRAGPRRNIARRQLPTAIEKLAALKVGKAVALTFLDHRKLRDGRAIGDVPLWELPRLAHGAAHKGADFLRRGLEDWTDAIACDRISRHAQPSSTETKVRDAMKAEQVEKIYAEARKLAAERIAEESERCARQVITPSEPAQIAG